MAGDQSESAGSRDFEPTNGEIAPLKKITKKITKNTVQTILHNQLMLTSPRPVFTHERQDALKNRKMVRNFFFFPPKNVKPFFLFFFFSGEALQKKKKLFSKKK